MNNGSNSSISATQTNRDVIVTSALGNDVLLFYSFHGEERLGRLSEFTVKLYSENREVDFRSVLGKPMSVAMSTGGNRDKRHFHGIVTAIARIDEEADHCHYQATVHPWLWLLKRSADCRIFQKKTVIQIVKEVCGEYGGIAALDIALLSSDYPALEYCVQYRESDFDFVCRLLEHAGIYFYFTHTADRHVMVLADSYGAHQLIDGYDKLTYGHGDWESDRYVRGITSWRSRGTMVSSKYVLNDFDYENAAATGHGGGLIVTAVPPGKSHQSGHGVYDYPGKYEEFADGNLLARARMESLNGEVESIDATTDAPGLYPGGLFIMAEHPIQTENRAYLITSARYEFTTNHDRSGASDGVRFDCNFTAIGKEHPYRPVAISQRPVMHGPQTAMVVGKAGEEIWTDSMGRIKVQFHWDRAGKSDENSSCWVRVAQGWAGKSWGAFTLPRIGMEVVVSFLEGDPDCPLVTGCVYNSDAAPPYALPAEQTITTVKSRSSKGGDGFNEIRFEDKKKEEEVYIHAERDFLRVVKNNDALKVGFETADKGDQTIDIKNDQTTKIGHDQTIKIGHDQTEAIDNNQTVTIKKDQKTDIGGAQSIKAGSTIVIEAGTSIELKVGGSSIKIEGTKITIKSTEIAIVADAAAKMSAGATMAIKAGATMEVKADAVMTIAGALVKIN